MNLSETYKTSLKALSSNKARTFLTMLGVIIGVFAVSSLISLGRGIQNYITDQFNALGSNLIFIVPGKADFTGDPAESFTKNKLDEKHLELISTYAGDYVSNVAPSFRVAETISYKTKDYAGSINGSTYDSPEIFNIELKEGRFLTRAEQNSKAKVAILGSKITEELFGAQPRLGEKIKIKDDSYEVIGFMEEKGQDFDEVAYIPYTSLKETLEIDTMSGIVVKAKDVNQVELTMKSVELAMLRDLDETDFSVLSQEDLLSSIQQILGALTAGLGAIAGISLIVGGIGIMNIMLVSVTERIREIGLRKALGATPFDIALQFLLESTTISVIGGMIGLFFGWLASLAARSFVRAEIPWWGVAIAFGFSVIVGVAFGTYPAIQASKKDPIEALRFE